MTDAKSAELSFNIELSLIGVIFDKCWCASFFSDTDNQTILTNQHGETCKYLPILS